MTCSRKLRSTSTKPVAICIICQDCTKLVIVSDLCVFINPILNNKDKVPQHEWTGGDRSNVTGHGS